MIKRLAENERLLSKLRFDYLILLQIVLEVLNIYIVI